jgi:ArsR family transcriptional regulator
MDEVADTGRGAALPAASALGEDRIAELADMFRMMGDPTRLSILLSCMDQAVAVNDIAGRLGLSPSLVSHHLRLLRATRLLKATRRGRQVFYSAVDEHVRCVLADMTDHVVEPATSDHEIAE